MAGRHPADEAIFRQARLRLTAWYVATLAVIILSFSVALYVALAVELPAHNRVTDNDTAQRVERETSDFALGRLRLLLVAGNLILLAGAAGGAYLLAGKTLRPIGAALARQRRFAADASHELRTPLTIILGEIDVALQRERSAADYRAVLTEVHDEVVALTMLVEHLLQLARVSGPVMSSSGGADVRAILAEAIHTTHDLTERHLSTVSLSADPELRTRMGAAALRQVCLNLMLNVLHHTPAGTALQIEAQRQGESIVVAVRDNGPGIPVGEREHVFEPFYRLAPEDVPGAGLGLALVWEFVTSCGGTVTVEETAGGGASVSVRLPSL
jgi:signal transduction histidine kinase